ncbi:MAG: M1 family peptidase [Candidatus Thiodiazotropha sp. (ex Myrtea sp. 'scaly one' KF741663)]|nr:M1 family peptidase [Candidatus Thiodiazotropha sp. (ex Myrtea sp. 'scaly one' KF741663)]
MNNISVSKKIAKTMGVMTKKTFIRCILPVLLLFCSPGIFAGLLNHDIHLRLDPVGETIQVADQITLPEGLEPTFLLHAGLEPRSPTPGVDIIKSKRIEGQVPLVAYRVSLPSGIQQFRLEYGGRIVHDFTTLKESPGKSRQRLAGTISSQGVYLDAATGWYPYFPDTLHTFSLRVDLPGDWLAVSQGAGPAIQNPGEKQTILWEETHPQDEIYLIAAPYKLYRHSIGDIEAQVFLRQADSALAKRYLEATETYLQIYQQLIGPYPYAKFALVENFWETGYGMPSFTLLGSRVIRLPFILHSSYPHEILHNWWGNSVFVDYESGNWSEGLTSYLADHLIAEQRGKGVDHRRSALKRYADFVDQENDFPLSDFRGRHTTASQAVGYDKSLMLFHMLRRKLGDERFIEGLRQFYRENQFRTAGFDQLQAAFEAVSQVSLGAFFQQWTGRAGAPALAVDQVDVQQTAKGYRLTGVLRQTQDKPIFALQVPIAIQCQDSKTVIENITMAKREQPFTVELPSKPLLLSVDPWFDLFRQLDSAETPPSLSQLFAADKVTIILPASAKAPLLEAYRELAQNWAADYADAEVRLDKQLKHLPDDRPVLLLGWENQFLKPFLDGLSKFPFNHSPHNLTLAGKHFDRENHSFAMVQRPQTSQHPLIWIGSQTPESLPGLTRKLPHYGKYSALVFMGSAPENQLKVQWPVIKSPLLIELSTSNQPPILVDPPPLFTR